MLPPGDDGYIFPAGLGAVPDSPVTSSFDLVTVTIVNPGVSSPSVKFLPFTPFLPVDQDPFQGATINKNDWTQYYENSLQTKMSISYNGSYNGSNPVTGAAWFGVGFAEPPEPLPTGLIVDYACFNGSQLVASGFVYTTTTDNGSIVWLDPDFGDSNDVPNHGNPWYGIITSETTPADLGFPLPTPEPNSLLLWEVSASVAVGYGWWRRTTIANLAIPSI